MENNHSKIKIALVGLGAAGSVIARLCQKDKQIEKIICFVRNIQKAKEFLIEGTKKIILKKIDIEKEKNLFIKNLTGTDVVINTASSKLNLVILDAAERAKINYLDLASHHLHNLSRAEQFEFNKRFKKRKLKGLICAGVAPGISNLLIQRLATKFDSIHEIKLRLVEHIISQDIISSWSPDLAIEELSQKVPVYKNGRYVLKNLFSDEEIYDYPQPFGKMPATLICQDEQITVPLFIKTKNMDVKTAGGDIETMKLFYRLGFFSKKAVMVKGVKICPLDLLKKILPPTPSPKEMLSIIKKNRIQEARFGIVVEIYGRINNQKIIKRTWMIFPSIFKINKLMPGATYISYPTGVAAYLFVKNLKNANFRGIIPPEGLKPTLGFQILRDFKKIIPIKDG